MSDRAQLVQRVRAALGVAGPRPLPQPPAIDERLVRRAQPGPHLVDLFIERAGEVGMRARRVAPGHLAEELTRLLQDANPRRAALCVTPGPLADAASSALRAWDGAVVDWSAGPGLDPLYDAGAGVTDVIAAIAETGTLVVGPGPRHSRGAFLVPPVHVALVEPARILPDLVDLWPALGPAQRLPAALTLISGPSKTADIEGILITGVHGPRDVHVLVVSE